MIYMVGSFKENILKKSNSYNYYKSEYNRLKKEKSISDNLNTNFLEVIRELKDIENEINSVSGSLSGRVDVVSGRLDELDKSVVDGFNELNSVNKILKKELDNLKEEMYLVKEDIKKHYEFIVEYLKSEMGIFHESNKIIFNYENKLESKMEELEIYNDINKDFLDNNLVNINAFKKIKKYKLFDYDYYISEYNYKLNLDPCLHYIYKGWKENKNPSSFFDSNYYLNSNKSAIDSGLNPLVYFVMYGLDKGEVKINSSIKQPKKINKIELREKLNNFNRNGVSNEKRNPKIIVSLTSYPKRIENIKFTLFSIFNQSLKPNKIILWLAHEEFQCKEKDIPRDVLNFKRLGLEIRWCDNIKSYKKLIPSLKQYPDDIIVTADDDIFYPEDWLERLYEDYLKYPNCIIGQRGRKIYLDNNDFGKYEDWKLIKNDKLPSFLNFLNGAGGILYPPNSLNKDIFNKNLFEKLCPTGDDIWFWAMAVKNKTKLRIISDNLHSLTYVSPAEELGLLGYNNSLWFLNSKGGNDTQMNNVLNKFPEIKKIIFNDLNGE